MSHLPWDYLFDADRYQRNETLANARELFTINDVVQAQKEKEKSCP